MSSADAIPSRYSRRDFFAIGGASVAVAAFLAACGGEPDLPPGRVGAAPAGTDLPTEKVSDAVRLRTASSVEHSIVGFYTTALAKGSVLSAEVKAAFEANLKMHQEHATQAESMTTKVGGTAWACSNPKMESVLLQPALERVFVGDPAKKIAASDDPARDLHSMAHVLESMSAAMYQGLVTAVDAAELRKDLFTMGSASAVAASGVAVLANPDRPWGLVGKEQAIAAGAVSAAAAGAQPTTTAAPAGASAGSTPTSVAKDAPAKTVVPVAVAFPAPFGQVGSQLLVVGDGDGNGVRFKAVVDTPADNSYIYGYMTPTC